MTNGKRGKDQEKKANEDSGWLRDRNGRGRKWTNQREEGAFVK
jgi:hypothetical protein